uniref:Uncharacterized protein n=1 Tax=Podoviridae sp. ctZkC8 TaxID=2825259 RepID=A0A8S5UBW9_9CAUD|nr:MAG TPA: hypothetical protein [Podoviridae sp. ctZkC8]
MIIPLFVPMLSIIDFSSISQLLLSNTSLMYFPILKLGST